MKYSVIHKLLASWLAFIFVFCSFGADALAAVLTLPSSTQVICEEAFYGATSLDEVVVPEGATEIQSGAFAYSTLNSIELPESLTYIADDAFEGVEGLSVNAPEGSYAAQWWAAQYEEDPSASPAIDFEYTVTNGEVTITKYIGTQSDVRIPGRIVGYPVTSIRGSVFSNRSDIISVHIPEGVQKIYGGFASCTSLTTVSIPSSVTYIGSSAFLSCSSLTSVVIP